MQAQVAQQSSVSNFLGRANEINQTVGTRTPGRITVDSPVERTQYVDTSQLRNIQLNGKTVIVGTSDLEMYAQIIIALLAAIVIMVFLLLMMNISFEKILWFLSSIYFMYVFYHVFKKMYYRVMY